jgi:hypothetical protein
MTNWNPPSSGESPPPAWPPPVAAIADTPFNRPSAGLSAPSFPTSAVGEVASQLPPPVAPPAPESLFALYVPSAELASTWLPGGAEDASTPSYVTAPVARAGRKKVAGIAAAVVLLVGGGATAMALQAANGGGADTPDKAVHLMLTALERGDLLGLVDTLPANERNMTRAAVETWSKEAARLGTVKDDVKLNKVSGFSFKLDGLSTSDETITKDIVNVSLDAGLVSISARNTGFGTRIGGLIGVPSPDDSDTPPEMTVPTKDYSTTVDLADMDEPIVITTVHDDEGWHPSLHFSAFDSARRAKDRPRPTANDAIPAKGSDTPEHAVADMLNALGSGDNERLIERLPPHEWAAAHVYGKTLVGENDPADAAYASVLTFTDLAFATESVKEGKKLKPTKVRVHVEPGTESDDDPADMTITKKGDCFRIDDALKQTNNTICASTWIADVLRDDEAQTDPRVTEVAARVAKQVGELGFVVVQEDGKWFVSPFHTVNDGMLTFVSVINKADIQALRDAYTTMLVRALGGIAS